MFINTVICWEIEAFDTDFDRDEDMCVVQVCGVISVVGQHHVVTCWDPARSAHRQQHTATGLLLRSPAGCTIIAEGIQAAGIDPGAEITT